MDEQAPEQPTTLHEWAGLWADVFGEIPVVLEPEPIPNAHPESAPIHMVPKMTSSELIDILTRFYTRRNIPGAEAWVVFTELMDNMTSGRIDLYVMSIWESQGMERIAYEVKVSRGDFLRELKQPYKRSMALKYSHRYYFATPPGLIKKEELPPEAGLVEVYPDGKVHFKQRAPRRNCPNALNVHFAAAVMRRAFRAMQALEGKDKE